MSKKFISVFGVILLAILACTFPGGTNVAAPNVNDTAVAQTVAAIAGSQTGGSTVVTNVPTISGGGSTALPPTATVTWTVEPTITLTATVTNTPSPCNRATMTSETVPDDSEINVSQSFIKTWTLKNVGSCMWTSGYKVIFSSGDAMSGPASFQLTAGTVSPGESIVVSVNLAAPAATGTYRGNWKLQSPEGEIFTLTTGNPFWVQIKAVSAGGFDFHLIPVIPLIPLLLPYTQQVIQSENIASHSGGYAYPECPDNTLIVGGGFRAQKDMVVYTTLSTGNGWASYVWNNTDGTRAFDSYAICLHKTSGSITQLSNMVHVAAGGIGPAVATCPAGSVVTSGGFASDADAFWVYSSSKSGNGWQVYAKNNSADNRPLYAYAVCLSGTGGSSSQIVNQKPIAAGASDGGEAACPAGSLLTGGGFALQNDLVVYYSAMLSSDASQWSSYARNTGGVSRTMNIYAICLTLP